MQPNTAINGLLPVGQKQTTGVYSRSYHVLYVYQQPEGEERMHPQHVFRWHHTRGEAKVLWQSCHSEGLRLEKCMNRNLAIFSKEKYRALSTGGRAPATTQTGACPLGEQHYGKGTGPWWQHTKHEPVVVDQVQSSETMKTSSILV